MSTDENEGVFDKFSSFEHFDFYDMTLIGLWHNKFLIKVFVGNEIHIDIHKPPIKSTTVKNISLNDIYNVMSACLFFCKENNYYVAGSVLEVGDDLRNVYLPQGVFIRVLEDLDKQHVHC